MRVLVIVLLQAVVMTGVLASQNPPANELPVEVQSDLLLAELTRLIGVDDHVGIIDLIPQIRALGIEIPSALYFLEARSLNETGNALRAQNSLLRYLSEAGREGRYYQEATDLLLALRSKAEAEAQALEFQQKKEQREQAAAIDRAETLKVREVQSLLFQIGFPKTPQSGELDTATREAIAVFQVRDGLEVTSLVNQTTRNSLRASVPDAHECDELAGIAETPSVQSVGISQIDYLKAVPVCNNAIRDFPRVIRFQIQYARALLAAGRHSDAVAELSVALEAGYGAAFLTIALVHESGGLTEKGKPDFESAQRWLIKAAEENHFEAQLLLARYLEQGLSDNRKNVGEAIRWIKAAADQEHPPAQKELGDRYKTGRGLNRDYTVAADWYRKAADQSHPLATYELAELYYRGRGVEKDRVRALEFYEKAAALDVKAAEARVDRLKR